ncbi:trimeric intracellular cation channel family protein [Halolamina sp. CBA1230]|uniref:trimeric intracellular cation channel family protein n=1 Tax=Halolamina sp. CBA1230 TaxID=1853690 RepID=UPI0009A16598|nr:trimeric intracellular cation channel family protein [Halolamina sp. CBA1230]QKY21167.1 trimeric intracellular cation channel family protein [Halolamina sp. CBA1230]
MVEAGIAFGVMNAIGLVAFAAVGALKGSDAGLDLFGVAVLGFLTALGGGTIRDLLVGRIPTSLQSNTEVLFAAAGIALAVALATRVEVDESRKLSSANQNASRSGDGDLMESPAVLLPDAVGLAAFAATGAAVGIEAGLSPFGVVVTATLTGVGGGSLSDLLLARIPAVLREDFYATPAVAGGAVAPPAVAAGLSVGATTLFAAGVVFGLRLGALRYGWRLPTV